MINVNIGSATAMRQLLSQAFNLVEYHPTNNLIADCKFNIINKLENLDSKQLLCELLYSLKIGLT